MSLFAPFRALGLVSSPSGVPFVVKRRGTESWVTVACEDSFAVYDCRKLTLTFHGARFNGIHVAALAVRKDWTFCAVGREVRCARRLRETCALSGPTGHDREIAVLHAFGHHLVSIDVGGDVRAWDVDDDAMRAREETFRAKKRGGDAREESESESESESELDARLMEFPRGFEATTVCHPDGLVDKLLFGSKDGRLALVNVRAGKLVHEFAGWGSEVAVLENSPASDVVAVGLEDGRVLLVDVRVDEVLFTLTPEKGIAVTALAFRTDDQDDVLCIGDVSGRVTVWDLEKRSLRSLILRCHEGPVAALHFLDGQPVMLSSGHDNTLKEWIFDRDDGEARLLRFRAGHSKPPTNVSFYGQGKKLLASGHDRTLRFFHAFRDQQNIEMSQKNTSKRAKKMGIAEEALKLPPVTRIAWGELRERDWANVITAHEGTNKAYTWRISKGSIGEHILQCPKGDGKFEVKAVCISACGNFGYLGAANGAVHRFNLQSGLHRGSLERLVDADEAAKQKKRNGNQGYNFPGGKRSFWALANQAGGNEDGKIRLSAHDGEVTCIQAECANRSLVTAGVDGIIRVWKFKEMKLQLEIDVGCAVRCGHLHEDGLFVVGCEDKVVRVYDTITGKRVRTYTPRGDVQAAGDVVSVQFSEHEKWIFILDSTGLITVYDVPAAAIVQQMILGEDKVTAMSFSPRMDFLVTVHEGKLGLYLWANRTMFRSDADVAYGRKVSVSLPNKPAESETATAVTRAANDRDDEDEDEDDEGVYVHPREGDEEDELNVRELEEYFEALATGPKQIEPGMITMSNVPKTQIETLLNLETVKENSKEDEKEKEPELAPFFLPTVAASDDVRRSVFDPSRESLVNADGDSKKSQTEPKSRILRAGSDLAGVASTPLISLLKKGETEDDYAAALEFLKDASPGTVDFELRSLGPWDHKFMSEEDVKNLSSGIKFFTKAIESGLYYELVNAHLSIFLEAHTTAIMESEDLVRECHALRAAAHKTYTRIDDLFNEVQCALSFHSGQFGT